VPSLASDGIAPLRARPASACRWRLGGIGEQGGDAPVVDGIGQFGEAVAARQALGALLLCRRERVLDLRRVSLAEKSFWYGFRESAA